MNTLDGIYHFISDKSYNGVTYGIANGGNADGIAYNKAVFEAAGYTSDQDKLDANPSLKPLPASVDDFIQALKDIKEKTDAIPLYTNFSDKWPMGAWDAYICVAATGDPDFHNYTMVHKANPFSDPGDGTGPFNVYRILYEAVAQGLCEPDPMSSDWEGSKGMINRGEIGCMVLGSWAVQQFKDAGDKPEDVAYMPFPITVTDDAGNRVTFRRRQLLLRHQQQELPGPADRLHGLSEVAAGGLPHLQGRGLHRRPEERAPARLPGGLRGHRAGAQRRRPGGRGGLL